jgi:hypothetical protein
MQMITLGKAMVGWMQADVRWTDYPTYTNSWENILAAMDAAHPAVKLLKQAADSPALDFHLDYQNTFERQLSHLPLLKQSAQILAGDAVCDLHKGDTGSAVTNLCTLLSLAQKDSNEWDWESQMARLAMVSIALSATWELLQSTNATDAQLKQLQACWQQQEYFAGAEGLVLMHRAWMERLIKTMRVSISEFCRLTPELTGGSAPSFSSSGDWLKDAGDLASVGSQYATLAMWQKSWSYDDEKRVLKKSQIMLDAVRTARTNDVLVPVIAKMDAELNVMKVTNSSCSLRYFFSELLCSRFPIEKFARSEVSRQMAVTSIALKRFRLNHGTLPENLSELVPDFLSSTPLDPMDGKPLRYHQNDDETFILYSVGKDGVDNGGDPTAVRTSSSAPSNFYWLLGRDWVWPQPATAAEIKMYYDEQAAKAVAENASVGSNSGLPIAPNASLDPNTGLPIPVPGRASE